MAVKIRLKRAGAKKRPFYRVVVADSRSPRDGRIIEEIGTYSPLTKPVSIKIDAERAQYWVGTGAQPTDTVKRLFSENGVLESEEETVVVEGEKVKSKGLIVKAAPKVEAAPVEEAEAEEPAEEELDEEATEE